MAMNPPAFSSDLAVASMPAAAADAAELSRLFNTIAEFEATPERLSPESMEHELSAYFSPHDERTLVVRDATNAIVAYATAYVRPSEAEEIRAYVNVYVAPFWRGRGLDDPMTDWAVAAASKLLNETTSVERYVCAWLFKKQQEASARFAARGFVAARHWWDMQRPLAAGIDPRPEEGFTVVPWVEEHDEASRLVYNSAFADHWGSTPMDAEQWRKMIIDSPNFRRGLSFVAIGNGDVIGYASCDEYPEDWEAAGQREGWIGGLGVVRNWRKRGVATALLARAMMAMQAAGVEVAMIGVDSDSPSGAQHLYGSLGFEIKLTGTTWQLKLG
jgi:GNAT superfamily N-acetyltransferase